MDYRQVQLEKGMYQVSGKTFSHVLEELDPSEQYLGTQLEGLDAFERQLKRFDIKVSGRASSAVEKFLVLPILLRFFRICKTRNFIRSWRWIF